MKTLKELRTDYGLTQKELGDLFGNDNLIMYTFDCLNMYNF